MKYTKSNHTFKLLEEGDTVKIRLTDNDGFSERPWAKTSNVEGEQGYILLNHALAFTPWPSWGAVMPFSNFNFKEMLEKQELSLHPDAYQHYLSEKWIDEEGNGLEQLRN